MLGLGKYKSGMAGPRVLLSLALLMGGMGGIVGRGTLAFFTSSAVSTSNAFQGGTVDLTGTVLTDGTTTGAFSWTTSGASGVGNTSTVCRNILTGQDIRSQGMAPGEYCVAPITILNTNANSIDAWMRIRLVRSTPSDGGANDALNDRLKFYMHEYTGGSAAQNLAAQTSDCTTATYKPTWAASQTAGAGPFSSVFGTSSGQIASGTSATVSAPVSRTALTSLGDTGKNLGAHPGISAVTPKTSNDPSADNTLNASTGTPYGAAQDTTVLGLVDASPETGVPTTGTTNYPSTTNPLGTANVTANVTSNSTSANGLRMRNGTGTSGQGVAPSEANMVTTLGTSRNAFNIVGNDEVTNPTHVGATTTGGASGATVVGTSSTTLTNPNGSNPHGTNAESDINKTTTRYYCAAIFFPADTDQNFPTVYASSAAGNSTALAKVFPILYDTTVNQWKYCVGASAGANCGSLGVDTTAITAANTKGDNAAKLGSNTYYMVVTAAQKAGRTIP